VILRLCVPEKSPANNSNAPIKVTNAPRSNSTLEPENAEGGESKDVCCVELADNQHSEMPKTTIKNPKNAKYTPSDRLLKQLPSRYYVSWFRRHNFYEFLNRIVMDFAILFL